MKKTIIFILIFAAILVSVWFRDGYILGTAEDGLIFYNISNYFRQAQYTWMEYPGLGSPSLSLIAGKPTYLILSLLQQQGIPGFLIQAFTIWFLLSSAGIAIYLLVKELFPKLQDKYILLSVLFYWFNPISIVNVWNRFLLLYIFFFALLPVATYLFIRGLRSSKFLWSIIFNVILIFYSYTFSYIAFSVLLWIWLFFLVSFSILSERKRKPKIFGVKYFVLTLTLFSIVNIWWILPQISVYFSGAAVPTADLFMEQNNLGSLNALSKSAGSLTNIFKLINATFRAEDSLGWVKVYYSSLLYVILYTFVGTILYLIIKFNKSSTILFLGSLFFLSVFLSKGNNPPFGEIYNFIFKNILIFQVFRNPFEKFGFLLSLSTTLLLSHAIFEFFKKYYALILIIILALGFPLYTNLAFTNKFPPTNDYSVGYKVKVPSYYQDVNNWLNSQGGNFRFIGFPLRDEGITYKWEKGYAGEELQVALFSTPGIIHKTSVPFFNQIVPEIEKNLLSENNFSTFANLLNAKYYLLRYDIDYKLRAMTDPAIIEQALIRREENGEVKKIGDFGLVSVWENLKWQDNTFYIANNIKRIESFDNADITDVNIFNGDIFLTEDTPIAIQKIDQSILSNISYEKINSTKYLVHLSKVETPLLLFFSELYNKGWKATYENGETIDSHFQANIFGNAWLVNRNGDFDIVIEFIAQKWMDLGEKISLGSYALMICILFFLIHRYRKNKT